MAGLTRSLVNRHALGRADAYDAALLDVAQDHLLYLLAEAGMFTDGQLVFKGGTSLRKCRLGNDGRFSTDLDFAAPNEDTVLQVCGVIDGARVAGFVVLVHGWYISSLPRSGGGVLELGMLGNRDTEGVGDVAQSSEAGRAVVVCFVALDLLFGHAERFGELTSGPATGDARLDEHRRQLL